MSPLSVLTLVKGRPEHFRQLLEGLGRSNAPPAELVVVDMSAEPLTMPDTAFPAKTVRLAKEGLPLSVARNRAAACARHDNFLFLDVDCIPSRDLVATMGAALDDRDALICAEVLYLAAGDRGRVWTEHDLLSSGLPHPARHFPAAGTREETNPGLFWSLAFGVRKSTFERLGGFDERFLGYGGEDTDLGFRAKQAGIPLLFLGGAPAFHQHHDVYDPPLQHFDDIVRNAELFHALWGFWPMDGWLSRFQERGLIAWHDNRIERVRVPSESEIASAKKPNSARY